MKKLLLMTVIFASGAAVAQKIDGDAWLEKLKKRNALASQTVTAQDLLAKYSHALPNGNKVYLLPQDNMPCVVPAPKNYSMPNLAGPNDQIIPPPEPGHIPNPGRKWKVIPIVYHR